MTSPHICILALAHPPDDGRVTHKVGHGLVAAGFRVSWIGPGGAPPRSGHGISFLLLPAGGGLLGRLRRRRSMREAARQVGHVDVWMGVEMDSAGIAVDLARCMGGKAVFDVHEVYHDDIVRYRFPSWLHAPASKLVFRRMTQLCRNADLVVGAGTTRIDPYRGVCREAMVVRHCLSIAYGEYPSAEPMSGARPFFRIMHGKASVAHGTLEVMRAVSWAMRNGSIDLRLVLFRTFVQSEGFGEQEIVAEADRLGIRKCIEWKDPVPFESMFEILRDCDLGVIAYVRMLGANSMPNRVFEYMAVGLPFIYPSYALELVSMLEGRGCAAEVDTEDPAAFGAAILELAGRGDALGEMGKMARRAFLDRFNMEIELKPLIQWVHRQVLPAASTSQPAQR